MKRERKWFGGIFDPPKTYDANNDISKISDYLQSNYAPEYQARIIKGITDNILLNLERVQMEHSRKNEQACRAIVELKQVRTKKPTKKEDENQLALEIEQKLTK